MQIHPIAHIASPYLTKFGVPRQPQAASKVTASLVVESRNAPCVASLAAGDFLWLVWGFSHNASADRPRPTVRPPRLGGTARMGVFATRSSYRPNGLALSRVEVTGCRPIDGCSAKWVLSFRGADMAAESPVYALYAYDPRDDDVRDALSGWVGANEWRPLDAIADDNAFLMRMETADREGLEQVLLQDPRPAYARSIRFDRPFWLAYCNFIVVFTVRDRAVTILDCLELSDEERELTIETGTIPQWAYDRIEMMRQ